MTRSGLRPRIITLTLLPMLLLGISLSGYFIHKRQCELENQLIFLGTAIIKPVAMAGGQALVNQDREPLRNLISELHNQQSNIVRSISIFTAEHELFVTSNHYVNLDTLPQPMPNLPLTEPLATQRLQDKIILQGPIFTTTPFNEQLSHPPISGYVTIELETTPNNLQFYQEITFASLMQLICFGIAAFFIYRLFQDLERPLKAIGETIDSIRQGHLDVRLENQPLGELNHLKDGINAMAQALAEYHFELQQSFEQATSDLRETLEQLEVQNVELDLAKKNAQAATRIKSEFIANMSHELRTPLNSIIGFTRQVLKTPLSQNQQDYLSTIERSANNLLKIINDILDFSKLEAGKLLIESITFDIEQIMDELMEQLAPMAHEKKLDLVLMLEPNIPRHLIGDPQRIQQIITNLVSNATKFTDTGMVQVKVVMLSQTPNTLTLQFIVQDPGIGIGEEQQSKLFEAFGQADASISRRYGGTGLGLVITKKLVQELRGKIGFSSTPQVGSTFWFSLTLEPSFDKRKTPTPQNAKLLLLNDDQMSAQALSDRLSYHGFDVTCCTSLTPNYASVDAVILYQNTKSETQFAQLSQQVTQAKALCSKVIVCLPSTEIILSEKLISIGASACLMTPVNLQKLLAYLQLPQFKPTPSCPPMLPPTPHVPAIALEKRVLAVDDNHANLKLLNMLLQNHDCATVLASSGKEALYLAQREAFSLILMDIQMPELDGVATCHAIRETALNADTPVVAVTAHAMPHDKALLQAQGMDDYLTKPIDEAILAQVIATWGHARSTFCTPESKPESQSNSKPSLDWQQALRLACYKEDLAKELLGLLVDSFTPIQKQINDALQEKPVDLAAVIHKFHGSCAYCGVPRLASLCFEIETALKQGLPIRYLEPELYELLDEMRNVRKQADELLLQNVSA